MLSTCSRSCVDLFVCMSCPGGCVGVHNPCTSSAVCHACHMVVKSPAQRFLVSELRRSLGSLRFLDNQSQKIRLDWSLFRCIMFMEVLVNVNQVYISSMLL